MEIIESLCGKADNLILYGAGTISNILYLWLQSKGLSGKVRCFAVTKRENNPRSRHGLAVLEAKEAVRHYPGALILLAVQNVLLAPVSRHLDQIGHTRYEAVDAERLLNEFYKELYRMPVEPGKILFSNMKHMGYGGNPKYIAEALLQADAERRLDLVWVTADETYVFPEKIRTVQFGSYAYYQELATAHIWVDNTRKQFDARKREGQYYIQTWHGAAPMKKVERDARASLPENYVVNAKRDSEMADLFLSGSEFYTALYRRSFWYDGPVMKAGLPRQDVFWKGDAVRKKVFEYYGIEEEKSLALYAPTFRRDFTNAYYDIDVPAVREALQKRFGKEFVFAVSKHPDNQYLEYELDKREYLAVEGYADFEELLAAADVLLTDYSGCMYDFSYTRRPVFLYQRDYELYLKDRDFYVPMEELPYPRACSNEELVRNIGEFNLENYQRKVEAFMDGMGNYDDGKASEKVAEHILSVVKGE